MFSGVTRFGHIYFTFVIDGDVVGFYPCGNEAGGNGVGDLAACAGAGVASGGDFNGDGVVGVDAEFFPGVGGVGFSGEGREEGRDGIFDGCWVGIEIGQEGRVFDHGDAGFRGRGGIGGGRVVGVEKRNPRKQGEEAEGCHPADEARGESSSGGSCRDGDRGKEHEVIKMQEKVGWSNSWGKACGLAGGGENGRVWVFLQKRLRR